MDCSFVQCAMCTLVKDFIQISKCQKMLKSKYLSKQIELLTSSTREKTHKQSYIL